MGCLWERRYGTNRTNPPRQKRIPISTGQRTVRRNRKNRRPIRLQSPWKPSPSPTERQEKKEKNNQKDNKNAQKRGTENLIRGKSVAPNLNIYAKHAPNPAYIPYIIHSVSAKRKINRKRTILRSAHKIETTGWERKTARLKTEKDKHPGHGNTPQNRIPDLSERKTGHILNNHKAPKSPVT